MNPEKEDQFNNSFTAAEDFLFQLQENPGFLKYLASQSIDNLTARSNPRQTRDYWEAVAMAGSKLLDHQASSLTPEQLRLNRLVLATPLAFLDQRDNSADDNRHFGHQAARRSVGMSGRDARDAYRHERSNNGYERTKRLSEYNDLCREYLSLDDNIDIDVKAFAISLLQTGKIADQGASMDICRDILRGVRSELAFEQICETADLEFKRSDQTEDVDEKTDYFINGIRFNVKNSLHDIRQDDPETPKQYEIKHNNQGKPVVYYWPGVNLPDFDGAGQYRHADDLSGTFRVKRASLVSRSDQLSLDLNEIRQQLK